MMGDFKSWLSGRLFAVIMDFHYCYGFDITALLGPQRDGVTEDTIANTTSESISRKSCFQDGFLGLVGGLC